jgi:hypothetical protein
MDILIDAKESADATNLERTKLPLFDSTETVFTEGFQRPWAKDMQPAVPWATVEECMQMARDALIAKQRVAEVMLPG